MVNQSSGSNSPLGTCRFTFPSVVEASTRNGATPPGVHPGLLGPHRLLRGPASWPIGGPAPPRTCPPCAESCRKGLPADRDARSVLVDNELLSRKPVVSLGATDGEFSCAVEDELLTGEGRGRSLQPSGLQSRRICSRTGQRIRCCRS